MKKIDRADRLKIRHKAYMLHKQHYAELTTEKPRNFQDFCIYEYKAKWYIESLLTKEEDLALYYLDMDSLSHHIDDVIVQKKNAADGMFRIMFPTKSEQDKRIEILREVQDQIEACEGFCRPLTEMQVKEYLQYVNPIQVSRATRKYRLFVC